jgi:transposase-like protein
MRYTIATFRAEFPDDDACLEAVFQNRFGDLTICPKCGVVDTKFYRVKKRQCYACMHCGYQLFPLAGTVFRKTTTSLWSWFYAIYLFSVSKNGVSAKELERALGVTYKTAWRMAHQIRLLMDQGNDLLGGNGELIEADEAYQGGTRRLSVQKNKWTNKEPIFGMVERYGRIKAVHVKSTGARVLHPRIQSSIAAGATIYTDDARVYTRLDKLGYTHESVNHSVEEYVRGSIHTNTIEGFWSLFKNSIKGTHHVISPKYLQLYIDEFAFKYNYRHANIFAELVKRA